MDKILDLVIAAVIMFVAPIFFIAQERDALTYKQAADYTDAFVKTISTNGFIDREMYLDYLGKLSACGLYEIGIEHTQRVYSPDTPAGYDLATYTDQILHSLDTDGIYRMQLGDTVEVSITLTDRTLARALEEVFLRSTDPGLYVKSTSIRGISRARYKKGFA